MIQRIGWTLLLGLFVTTCLSAQIDSIAETEGVLDFVWKSGMDEADEEEITERLSTRRAINLNRMNPADLMQIPFLTADQRRNLSGYLSTYGEIYSFYELQSIEGFDSALIRRLIPYIVIGPSRDQVKFTCRNLLRSGRHELVTRYQQVIPRKAGYLPVDSSIGTGGGEDYPGSPQRYYFRYRYSFANRVVIGFSGDKDAGEECFSGHQPYGMDFYSGFLSLQDMGWLRQLTFGHFRVSFGQGLTLGGNAFGGSVGFGNPMRYTEGIRASQSVSEYGYLNGVALTARGGRVETSLFGSFTRRDAYLLPESAWEGATPTFSSFSESGYHRTQSELDRKNRISERMVGGHISFRGEFFVAGLSGYWGSWSGILEPGAEVRHAYSIRGSRFGAYGVSTRCRIGLAYLFGEFSVSLNGGIAWLAGVNVVPVREVDLLVVGRNYQPQYQNPMSRAMSQGSSRSNEQGIFIRLQTQSIPGTVLTGYLDLFRFPWLRYRVDGPSTGVEAGIMGLVRLPSSWSVLLKYTLTEREVSGEPIENAHSPMVTERADEVKTRVEIEINQRIGLRSSVVYRTFRSGATPWSSGCLVSQEIDYKSPGFVRNIRLLYSLFDVPTFATRIYSWEPDMAYSWSFPAYYGKGFRSILLVRLNLSRRIELAGWAGFTWYADRTTIGSGPDEIKGNSMTEVKVQVRLKL